MLVLSRRVGEEIVIGGNIRVTVLEANGKRVRLGIVAPHSVTVVRKELLPSTRTPPANAGPVTAPAVNPNQK